VKKKLLFWVKCYLFWVAFAWVSRAAFACYQWEETLGLGGVDVARIFWKGARVDLSFGAYVMMLTSLVLAVGVVFFSPRATRAALNGLTALLLFAAGGVVAGDLEVFRNWGYHVDATLLLYLKTPGVIVASSTAPRVAGLLAIWLALAGGGYWLYRSLVALPRSSPEEKRSPRWHALPFLLLVGALVLPARGGLNVAPMNASFVYFHPSSMYANQAALNPAWNFLYEVLHVGELKDNYHFMPPGEANELVDSLYREDGEYPRVLATSRPNVVVLLLETFTSNAWDVMPNVQAVAREGILFSNIYATGNRSDRGLTGLISGFPSYPPASLLKYPARMHACPRFPLEMEREGYNTAFYYAGDLNFAGFRSYITMTFQRSVTEDDFSGEAVRNAFKWGVHDEYMLERLHEDLCRAPAPFLRVAFTMSSHEPFEVPGEPIIVGDTRELKLMNAIAYADRCLGDFFRRCKESGAWDNALFVLVADHGTRHVGNLAPHAPSAYKIPVIFTGGAMTRRDTVVTTLGSQTDVAATLLAQLDMDYSRYRYSKNLLNPRALPFAYYAYSSVAALVDARGACILDLKRREGIGDNKDPRSRATLEAYLQVLEEEFKEEFKGKSLTVRSESGE
jgi:phosphoglycerol transferase MdoB-like AlkP superfamily enzyme